MLNNLMILISGIIFGLGLIISSMTNPQKVLSFLDIFGAWDPSLAFVMAGAILVVSPFLYYFKNKNNLVLSSKIDLPKKTKVDFSLIIGASLFGIGWGTIGFCPGPAISSVAFFDFLSILFLTSMLLGFYFIHLLNKYIKIL